MSGQESRGSAGEYQADERAGVARLSWGVSGHSQKAEIDVFLELSCFFNDPADVGNLISDSSAFSKTSLNIWQSLF